MTEATDTTTLYEGKFLSLVSNGRWEFTTRVGTAGVVAIVAVTDDDRVVLVEQFRPPVGKFVVEIPAGLVGDTAAGDSETFD